MMGAKLDNQTILTVQGLKKYFPIKRESSSGLWAM